MPTANLGRVLPPARLPTPVWLYPRPRDEYFAQEADALNQWHARERSAPSLTIAPKIESSS